MYLHSRYRGFNWVPAGELQPRYLLQGAWILFEVCTYDTAAGYVIIYSYNDPLTP